MRLDKYLWAVRIYKTRTMAADAIKGGKVKFDGESPKPAREAKVGEEYQIQLGELQKSIRVLDFPKNRVAAKEVMNFHEELTPSANSKSNQLLKEYRFVIPLL